MQHITAEELKLRLDNGENPVLLDVREPWEYEICHIDNSLHISMAQVPSRLNELDPDNEIVVVCHHGMRSMQVAGFLESQGYKVSNLTGGIDAWATAVDGTMQKY